MCVMDGGLESKRGSVTVFDFYESSERIQGCSACRSGLGSHDKHVALASVIRNTRLVLGSFSARYILESNTQVHSNAPHAVRSSCSSLLCNNTSPYSAMHLHIEYTVYLVFTPGYVCRCAHIYTLILLPFLWDCLFMVVMKVSVSAVVNIGE